MEDEEVILLARTLLAHRICYMTATMFNGLIITVIVIISGE